MLCYDTKFSIHKMGENPRPLNTSRPELKERKDILVCLRRKIVLKIF